MRVDLGKAVGKVSDALKEHHYKRNEVSFKESGQHTSVYQENK